MFLINTAPLNVYSVLHYHFYFFVKIFFFECLYPSEYDIRMFLFVFWLRSRSSIKYLSNWGNKGDHPKYAQVRTGGEGHRTSCDRTHVHFLFSCCYLMVSSFICRNLILPSFKKDVFVRNGYFSPMTSISVVMK